MNIAQRLKETAARMPDERAVVVFSGRDAAGRAAYTHVTFRQLDRESDLVSAGLRSMGVGRGTRLVLMVRFGIEFVSLVFAAFKAGAVIVLVDPGMGLSNVLQCLEDVDPEGFLAIPGVHAVRVWNARRFPSTRFLLTVGRRWLWGGATYRSFTRRPWQPSEPAAADDSDPAAVIFTSGSTGPPKGVVYEHGMFNAQVELIRDRYAIKPGGVDLSGFPLFGLFNAAMGTTTVVPPMNPSKPARANPARLVETLEDQAATQSFGSPALWNLVSRHCERRGLRLTSLRRVFSAGAPVPTAVVERMSKCLACDGEPDRAESATVENPANDSAAAVCRPACGEMHTPYGATEALPVATISAREILERTAERTRTGAGTCVGRAFPGVRVKIVEIVDGPIARLADATELPAGQIGEIIVQGPSVTRRYVRRPEADRLSKIADCRPANQDPFHEPFWHRMGDVGYFDQEERLWFCGRKSHIVWTRNGPLYTEPCEAVLNEHPRVARTALVGVGKRGEEKPVIIVEPQAGQFPLRSSNRRRFAAELRDLAAGNPLTLDIRTVLFHRRLPVDVRHNSKINRERLALWAANEVNGDR